MNKPAKFMFDEPFDVGAQVEPEPDKAQEEEPAEPTHSFTESQLTALRQQVREEGFGCGRNEALSEAEALSARALARIEEQMATLLTQWEEVRRESARQGVFVAIAAAKKLAGALLERYPLGETEALLHALLMEQQQEPRIVIRVAAGLLEALKGRIEDVTGRSAYPGDVVLLADDALGPSDCRVEWADGGAERHHQTLMRAIDDVAARFLNTARDGNPSAAPAQDMAGED